MRPQGDLQPCPERGQLRCNHGQGEQVPHPGGKPDAIFFFSFPFSSNLQTLKKDLAGEMARRGSKWNDHVADAMEAYNARPVLLVHVGPVVALRRGPVVVAVGLKEAVVAAGLNWRVCWKLVSCSEACSVSCLRATGSSLLRC